MIGGDFLKWSPIAVVVISAVFLTSCQSTPKLQIKAEQSSTVLIETQNSEKTDNTTAKFAYVTPATKRLVLLEDFLSDYIRDRNLGESVSYLYNFADLNGDGDNEVLVSIHLNKEKSGQLRLVVSGDYKGLLGELQGAGPLIVTENKRNQWSVIALYDRDGLYKTAIYKDGQYNWAPMSKENVIQFTEISGTAYLSDEELFAGFAIL